MSANLKSRTELGALLKPRGCLLLNARESRGLTGDHLKTKRSVRAYVYTYLGGTLRSPRVEKKSGLKGGRSPKV